MELNTNSSQAMQPQPYLHGASSLGRVANAANDGVDAQVDAATGADVPLDNQWRHQSSILAPTDINPCQLHNTSNYMESDAADQHINVARLADRCQVGTICGANSHCLNSRKHPERT